MKADRLREGDTLVFYRDSVVVERVQLGVRYVRITVANRRQCGRNPFSVPISCRFKRVVVADKTINTRPDLVDA